MLTVIAHVLVALSLSPGASTWPLEPRPEVVEGFAPPASEWAAGHRGVDLLGSQGQTVLAARDGAITFAGLLAGRGVVVVGHGETRTTYQPVDATVSVGDHVRAGQEIGTLRTFGSHCWPRTCLHWGLIEGETYLDPLTLVGGGPVRLLPLHSGLPSVGWASIIAAGDAPTPWAGPARPGGVPGERPGVVGLW